LKTFNSVSCIKIGEKELRILVLDLLTKKVIWRKALAFDFEVFDISGVIQNPSRVASFIENAFKEYKLPRKVRVSLSSEYLNLNILLLPSVPEAELHQIILDEAAHQSVYSFTHEKVAVAYLILKDKVFENGIFNTEILTVTTLQSAIDQISEIFNHTGLDLEAIAPAFWGVSQYLAPKLADLTNPVNLILISNHDSEVYTWDGYLRSCHYMNAGTAELPKLQNEVTVSLEHFNKQTMDGNIVPHVLVVGEKCELKPGAEYSIDYMFEDPWPDLHGLALINDLDDLNFLTKIPEPGADSAILMVHKFWPLILGSLVFLNILMGWNCWSSFHQCSELKNEDRRLKNSLLALRRQSNDAKNQQAVTGFKIYVLLGELGKIVPEEMVFNHLILDIGNKNLQIDGFCLNQKDLNVFLKELPEIKGIKSIDNFESSRQIRANLTGNAFRFNLSFTGDLDNEQ
jgi:hypothetical protein